MKGKRNNNQQVLGEQKLFSLAAIIAERNFLEREIKQTINSDCRVSAVSRATKMQDKSKIAKKNRYIEKNYLRFLFNNRKPTIKLKRMLWAALLILAVSMSLFTNSIPHWRSKTGEDLRCEKESISLTLEFEITIPIGRFNENDFDVSTKLIYPPKFWLNRNKCYLCNYQSYI